MDLDSRHGTRVDGRRLKHGERHPLEPGSLIEFGRWRCRVAEGSDLLTILETGELREELVSIATRNEFEGLAQARLDALLESSRRFHDAKSLGDIADALLQAVSVATGCQRVAIAERISSAEFKNLASTLCTPHVSRSLIDTADRSRSTVVLGKQSARPSQARSIIALDIRSALCCPIIANGKSQLFLYLDTRGDETPLPEDATAFCMSVAQLAGMSVERILNAELVSRHAALENDLEAARLAQQVLMPAASGTIRRITYAHESLAGRVVAGDLFDIFVIDTDRTAVLLGDVSGKGVGAAILMAAVQTQTRALLRTSMPLGQAMNTVNDDLFRRSAANMYITMMAVIIDAKRQVIEVVDAGHGLGAIAEEGGTPHGIELSGGVPLSIDDHAEYEVASLPFRAGSTLILMSDGVVEQADSAGSDYGFARALRVASAASSPAEMTARILKDVRGHSDSDLADDLTVAAVRLDAETAPGSTSTNLPTD